MGSRWLVPIAMVTLSLAACGQPTSTGTSIADTAPSTATAGPTGRLRVTHHQISCCYVEGQLTFVNVTGATTIKRQVQSMSSIMPVVDVDLAPGTYQIESYQQPCNANCGMLDPPTSQCSMSIDVAEGDTLYFTVEASFDVACTITQTDVPLQSPVPDEFALRDAHEDCGVDSSLTGGSRGLERECFADANSDGRLAELTSYEPGLDPDDPDLLIYRTTADRSLEVFLPGLDRAKDGPWRMFTCTGLEPDEAHDFATVGCTEPVEIGPEPGAFIDLDSAALTERAGCALGRFYALSADETTLVTVDLQAHYQQAIDDGGAIDESFDVATLDGRIIVETGPDVRGFICTDVGRYPVVDRTYRTISGSGHVTMSLSPASATDPYWKGTGTVSLTDVSLIADDGSEMHIADLTIENAPLGSIPG